MTDGKIYSIAGSSTVFLNPVQATKNIIIKATSNSLYYDNLYIEKGVNLFESGIKIDPTDITDSNLAKCILFTCFYDGVCTAVDGFIKNDTSYYSMASAGGSSNVKYDGTTTPFGTGCSAPNTDGSKILEDGSLCLGTEAAPFISEDDKADYYITYDATEFKYVRAVKNIFTKEEFDSTKGIHYYYFFFSLIYKLKNGEIKNKNNLYLFFYFNINNNIFFYFNINDNIFFLFYFISLLFYFFTIKINT